VIDNPDTESSIAALRARVTGRVIVPGDADYEAARMVAAGAVDRRPAAIVRVADAADVGHVVEMARETGLELAVRSGGHSNAGHGVSEGGIVVDLRDMKALDIDPEARTAWAETGLTAAEVTDAAAAHGWPSGFGDTGSVGIGGITLGGGIGYLVRKHGLTIDSLLAAEVVTADGQLRHVDADHDPDLFWAIRGGGGNFGVATRFLYRLHALPSIVGGMLMLPATPEVIAGFLRVSEEAPDELSTIANVMGAPPMPFLAPEHHGKLVVMALVAWSGDAEAGERAIAPLRALATPLTDMVREMPYPEIYGPEDHGDGDYRPIAAVRTMFMDRVDETIAATIVRHLEASDADMKVAQLRVLGGAMSRVPADATAFAHRASRIMVNVAALYRPSDHASVHERWVDAFADELRQDDAGAYVNFLATKARNGSVPRIQAPRGSSRVREAPLRPHEPVPPEPEHPARDRGSRCDRGGGGRRRRRLVTTHMRPERRPAARRASHAADQEEA
jgi:hypothetical protein